MTITTTDRALLLGALRACPTAQLIEALEVLTAEFTEVTEAQPTQAWSAAVAF